MTDVNDPLAMAEVARLAELIADRGSVSDMLARAIATRLVRAGVRIVDAPCDHIDAYGSTVMEGGPYSAHPGIAMCIVCDAVVIPA